MGATASQPRASRGRASAPPAGSVTDLKSRQSIADGAQLAGALLAIQAAAPKLKAETPGQVGPRQYKYVDLDAVLDIIVPLYQEHGVNFRAMPCRDEHGDPALRYRFTHVDSGEYEEDLYPLMLERADSQGLGSAITYARRYVQLAVLNLAPGDDDDGAAASVRHINDQQPAGALASNGGRPASAKQKAMLSKKAQAAHLSNVQFANILLRANGEPDQAFADDAAAQRIWTMKLDRLPGARVDFVIEQIDAVAS